MKRGLDLGRTCMLVVRIRLFCQVRIRRAEGAVKLGDDIQTQTSDQLSHVDLF